MANNIFTLENIEHFSERVNIDDLYDKKKQYDLNKLALFNKILHRIHVRIKTISRQKIDEQFCWFIVPEVIIGVPKYDQGSCIAYLLDKLKDNGFNVRYIHPNTLFISWNHWVPSYVRTELKKKTGIVIDEYGQKVEDKEKEKEEENNRESMFTLKFDNGNASTTPKSVLKKQQDNKKYTPIQSYKPTGNMIYNEEMFSKMENKFG